MDKDTISIWVERILRYSELYDKTLQPLRDGLTPPNFLAFYNNGADRWAEEERMDPNVLFHPEGDDQVQDTFYRTIDGICATLDTVEKGDWPACVRLYHSKPHC